MYYSFSLYVIAGIKGILISHIEVYCNEDSLKGLKYNMV